MGKIPPIPLKLNFTPNTLGCYGLIERAHRRLSIDMDIRKVYLEN